MRYVTVVLALLAAGCSGKPTREEFEEHNKRITDLDIKITNKNEAQVETYLKLVDANRQILENLGKLENQILVLKTHMEDLDQKYKSPTPPAPPPGGSEAPPKPANIRKLEDILLEAERALTDLREGKVKAEDIAEKLKPYAKETAPVVAEELRKPIARIDYTRQLEVLLGSFPASSLQVPIQKLLMEPGVRVSAARIVGRVGDKGLSKLLEDQLTSPDEDFKLMAAESLVLCRNVAGVTALVQCLRSEQRDTKIIAINALRRLNNNQDLGYRAQRGAEENAAALKAWDEWAAKTGKHVFD